MQTINEDELNQFCCDLPRYKRPRKIIFAPVIRNATGKIDKPKLREIYGGERLVENRTDPDSNQGTVKAVSFFPENQRKTLKSI